VKSSPTVHSKVDDAFRKLHKPVLDYKSPEEYIEAYDQFYDEAVLEMSVLAE